MDDRELVAIIKSYRSNSLGSDDGELSSERAKAFDHYHGRPYGNEKEGRSDVVTKDLAETVDWAMPGLMKIFMSSGNVVEFTPVGPEDEPLAEQETDYVNHVIMKDNDAFTVFFDWFKDALILKNGYVKHWWDESTKISENEYENLTEDELTMLITSLEESAEKVEITAKEEKPHLMPDGSQMVTYDVNVKVTHKVGRVKIEAVPVEEVRIARSCRGSLQTASFVEHVTTKTRSELVEMGMDKDFVWDLPAIHEDDENDTIKHARDSVSDETDEYDSSYTDESMQEVEFCEAYILVDWDGDGIAERRKVVTVGNRIPDGEEWNEPIDAVPLTSVVPKRVPHRHVGESLDDDISDLQLIHTTLLRQMLDNIYRTNNQEMIINDRAVLGDFLITLPGGVKRLEGEEPVNGHVMPVTYQPILNQILPAIEHIKGIKEHRTGINELNTNISADVLKNANNAALMEGISKASQKMEMIARFFAEGVKELVLQVHHLLMTHQDHQRIVKMRGQYVPINPSEWKERTDLNVKVGLGTGTEEEKRLRMMLVADLMERLGQFGLISPDKAYNMFEDIVKILGLPMPDRYAMDPKSQEYQQYMQQQQQSQQNQPNPLAEAEQVKAQAALQIQQMRQEFDMQMKQAQSQFDAQMEQYKEQIKHEQELNKLEADMMNKQLDRQSNEDIKVMQEEVKLMLAGFDALRADLAASGIGAGLQDGI